MAYSADNQQEHQLNLINATAAPPPTPVAQPNSHLVSSAAAADVLSSLLRRLPPTLSLPTRRSCNTTTTTTSAPVTSLSDPDRYDLLLSASSELGFFQLTDHNIPSQLANSAELEALSLFDLTRDKKEAYFPKNWPLGFEDDEYGTGESFWFDPTCSSESSELGLDSLRELSQALEKVALEIVEMLSSASRFESPGKVDPTRVCSLMLVHQSSHGDNPATSGGSYPYVVGLQYQIRSQKFSILADSGWTTVSPQVNSVMVTIGDVAQVCLNLYLNCLTLAFLIANHSTFFVFSIITVRMFITEIGRMEIFKMHSVGLASNPWYRVIILFNWVFNLIREFLPRNFF
uniref:Non-haem dioxygenase N-terminal domain-containing protein n=1 Tax=Rhizophora mucronata TaxID=61149 RepID=A0A2P2JCV8_RHIMU